jgi:hypothetical protein
MPKARLPLSPLTLCHADDLGGAKGVEAVHECDADLDFGGLAVGVSCGDAFAKDLQSAHPLPGSRLRANNERFRLDPASYMVSGPALPERPAIVPGGAQSFGPDDCSRAVLFPRPAVLSDRYDWNGLPVDDGSVATARVIGAVHCPAGFCDAMSREGRSPCRSPHPRGSGRVALAALGCHRRCWG